MPYSGQYIGPTQIPSGPRSTRTVGITIGYTGQGEIQQPQGIPQQPEPSEIPGETIEPEPVGQPQGATVEGTACPCVGQPCTCLHGRCTAEETQQFHGTIQDIKSNPDGWFYDPRDDSKHGPYEEGKCYCNCWHEYGVYIEENCPNIITNVIGEQEVQCPGSTVEQPQEIPQPPTDQSGLDGQQQGNEMYLGYEITGYSVYLDGNYVGTDGENGDALDGNFIIHDISCWGTHTIVVDDGEFTHTLEYPFDCGIPYSINVGDDLFVVGSSQ